MDEGFYINPGIGETWDVTLTDAQALRFLIRAASSFVVTPLPWEMASRSELAFLPEHLLWYVLVLSSCRLVSSPDGGAIRCSPRSCSAIVIPTAVAVALTNGNVGTLLRMRGLVSPYLLWLSTLGLLALTEAVIRARAQPAVPRSERDWRQTGPDAMNVIDNRGRLFGLINLVDAAVVGFLLVLLPVAYGTYLLFRPARPHIESVTLTAITKEENRIAGSAGLTAKLKVKGSGLNPLLRGDDWRHAGARASCSRIPTPPIVLVGPVGPNDHDLILYDGIQEVARAVGAVKIPANQPGVSSFIRGVGRFRRPGSGGRHALQRRSTNTRTRTRTSRFSRWAPVSRRARAFVLRTASSTFPFKAWSSAKPW